MSTIKMKGNKGARNNKVKGRDGETRIHGEGSISGMDQCRAWVWDAFMTATTYFII